MRLCIADPPYLGVAAQWYGDNAKKTFQGAVFARSNGERKSSNSDNHEHAANWDDPAMHEALVARLMNDYDGWAIAMAWYNLRDYLQWVPRDSWLGIWDKGNAPPGGSRLHNVWEPVIVYPPRTRRKPNGPGTAVRSLLTAPAPQNFVGAKPPAWTRWVLDMLGYDQDTDTVDDLFPGSGAVAGEIAQLILPMRDNP